MSLTVVVAGHKSVGKSSLIKAFIKDANDVSSVKGGDYNTNVTINAQKYPMKIIEDSGDQQLPNAPKEAFSPFTPNVPKPPSYPYAPKPHHNAQVIVYNVSSQESFDFINNWIFLNRADAPTILLANGCDLFPKGIEGKEEKLAYGYCRNHGSIIDDVKKLCSKYYGKKINGKEYAKTNNMTYYEVSAETKMNINIAFKDISEKAQVHHQSSRRRMFNNRMIFDRRPAFRPQKWNNNKRLLIKQLPPQPPQYGQQQQQQQYIPPPPPQYQQERK